MNERILHTFLTVFTLVTSIADACAHYADSMSPTVDINALVGWYVTLSTFPPAVTLATAAGVLAVTTAQHRAGG